MGIRDMQRKIRELKADIEEAEAAEDLWPCPPNEKRIAYFRELLEYYEADLEALREARHRVKKSGFLILTECGNADFRGFKSG